MRISIPRDDGLRRIDRSLCEVCAVPRRTDGRRLRASHSRLASLPAALGGDSRSSPETSLLLHRACYPQIWCKPGQRDRRNARPGFRRGRDFLQGGCYVGSSLGLGPIPCCSIGLGNRALSWRNHGVCHQSRSRPGPRLAYSVLPIANKGASDWSYAAVPVLGPLIGGAGRVASEAGC